MTQEITSKYLGTITSDLIKIVDNLKEASYLIRKRGFSDYPIFIISKNDIPIGQVLYRKEDFSTSWNYNVTYVDEFVQRKIIAEDKLDIFLENYKNPDEFCCLFVIDRENMNFVFVPYPED